MTYSSFFYFYLFFNFYLFIFYSSCGVKSSQAGKETLNHWACMCILLYFFSFHMGGNLGGRGGGGGGIS